MGGLITKMFEVENTAGISQYVQMSILLIVLVSYSWDRPICNRGLAQSNILPLTTIIMVIHDTETSSYIEFDT